MSRVSPMARIPPEGRIEIIDQTFCRMFSFLTQPNFPKTALGIEDRWLSAVSLGGGRNSLNIRQAATIDLPPGVIKPDFYDSNILDVPAFRSLLNEVMELAGLLGQKRWSVALPSGSARSSIITLDAETSSRSETEQIIDWKCEQAFGAPAEEMRVTRQKISLDSSGRVRYFATAVRRPIIDEYESIFEGSNLSAGLILPRAVAEAHWLNSAGFMGDGMLISSNADGFTALVSRNGEPAVVRSVTCSTAEADDEIYRLLMFYRDRFDADNGPGLGRLMVLGRDLEPQNIRRIAAEALGHDVEMMDGESSVARLSETGLSFDELAAPAGLAIIGI